MNLKNDTYSLKSLATITQSSKRTLITDIQTLREFFKDSLAIHSTKFGYSIEEIDPDGYLKQNSFLSKTNPFSTARKLFQRKYSLLDWSLALNLSEQALLNYFKNQYLLSTFSLANRHKSRRIDWFGNQRSPVLLFLL